jgi:hypothetical protein
MLQDKVKRWISGCYDQVNFLSGEFTSQRLGKPLLVLEVLEPWGLEINKIEVHRTRKSITHCRFQRIGRIEEVTLRKAV